MKNQEDVIKKTEALKNQESISLKEGMTKTYEFIKKDSDTKGYSLAKWSDLIKAVFGDSEKPYCAYDLARCFKQELRDLGYVQVKKVNEEWQTSIKKERDF